jgi:hypothetical protein
MTRNLPVSYSDDDEVAACLMCSKPMRLVLIEDQYLGYSRRTFGCYSCDGTMTEWVATPNEDPYFPQH